MPKKRDLGPRGSRGHPIVKIRYQQFKKQAMSIKRPLKTEQVLCKNLIAEMDIFQINTFLCSMTSLMGMCYKIMQVKLEKELAIFHQYKLKIEEYRYSQF